MYMYMCMFDAKKYAVYYSPGGGGVEYNGAQVCFTTAHTLSIEWLLGTISQKPETIVM